MAADATTGEIVLDRAAVISLVSRAPAVALAEARVEEARAFRVGAGALAPTNPDLTFFGGPRQLSGGGRSTDFVLSLSWPLDVSGARGARRAAVEEMVGMSEAESADARRLAVAEALGLWIQARGAAERVALETARAKLDDELLRIANVRRSAGVAGDAEVALANVIAAEGRARLLAGRGQEQAAIALLRGRLGLSGSTAVRLEGALSETADPPSLEALLLHLPGRPDVVRAERAVPASRAEASREARLGLPVPRVIAGVGRENETFARVGVDLPLPIYQRNQTNRAVTEARIGTAAAQQRATLADAEADLRAAHAVYGAARESWRILAAVLPSVADVEKLATRSYELGSMPLASVVVGRREAAIARAAHLEALIALALARAALDRAAGALP